MYFNANLNNTNVFYFCMVAVNVISFKKPEFLEKARADERQGRIQDFKLGGAHLKKLHRAEGGAKIVGVFRVKKIMILRQKMLFFPILGGGARAGCVPHWIRPWEGREDWIKVLN